MISRHAPIRLIVNADDFGISDSANRAIERAHREGILTSASLMVAGEAAEAATGASTLGRIAGMGLRGAAEGALFGAGHEVSQAALEDVPLTAERLLAGAWDGTKMGGAFGLGLGVIDGHDGRIGRTQISEPFVDLPFEDGE